MIRQMGSYRIIIKRVGRELPLHIWKVTKDGVMLATGTGWSEKAAELEARIHIHMWLQ